MGPELVWVVFDDRAGHDINHNAYIDDDRAEHFHEFYDVASADDSG